MITEQQFEEICELFFAEYVCNEFMHHVIYAKAVHTYSPKLSTITSVWAILKAQYNLF